MKDDKGNWRLPVEPARPGAAPTGRQVTRRYVRAAGGVVTLDGAPVVDFPGLGLAVHKDGKLETIRA